jgi:hypothetical protein
LTSSESSSGRIFGKLSFLSSQDAIVNLNRTVV